MCSVGDDGDRHMPSNVFVQYYDTKCQKCKLETPIVLLRRKDSYCKDCFLSGTNHKFKSLLGKSKLLRPKDRVLVSYEVGHPSTALLHLIRSGLDLNTPKKLRFEPVFVFLEDQYHLTKDERSQMITRAIAEAEKLKFKMHLVSFAESIMKDDVTIYLNHLNLNDNDGDAINNKFATKINNTNKKEVSNILRRNILLSIAKKLSCKFIFTPELSVDIAANLLTNISLGRGSQVPVDTGFCDDRDKDVKILRPLRSFDKKEVALYNVLHVLEPVTVRQTQDNQYASIQALAKQFINELNENYPATVATVVKTGDKLALDENKVAGNCKLCKGNILKPTEDLTSDESTSFSKLVSNELPDHSISSQERYEKVEGQFEHKAQVDNEYCFSCSKISRFLLSDT
ncbi:unnamed protein product [Ceutorhynchus assimilis]|uniref:Cytoplasmic tRNA 2-thiolation protein 2 n=1 Tax=Ceutorhynchus assimilis TaxID=467358 RepID=A0A9N9MYP8_9CUCU|nr:unnamed protein product [Ceutorhynchus assimilis]